MVAVLVRLDMLQHKRTANADRLRKRSPMSSMHEHSASLGSFHFNSLRFPCCAACVAVGGHFRGVGVLTLARASFDKKNYMNSLQETSVASSAQGPNALEVCSMAAADDQLRRTA